MAALLESVPGLTAENDLCELDYLAMQTLGRAGIPPPRAREGHALWADVQVLLASPTRDASAVAALSARVRAWVAHVSGEERTGELVSSFRKSLQTSSQSPPAAQAQEAPRAPHSPHPPQPPLASLAPLAPLEPQSPQAPQTPYAPQAPQAPHSPQAPQAPHTPQKYSPHAATDAVLPSLSAISLGSDESAAGPSWAKGLGTSPPPPPVAERRFDGAQKTCSNSSSPLAPSSHCTSMYYPPRNLFRRSFSEAPHGPIPIPISPPATESMAMYYPDDRQSWAGPARQWPGPAHQCPGPWQPLNSPSSPTWQGQQHAGFARSHSASPHLGNHAHNFGNHIPHPSASAPLLPSSWGRPEQVVTSVELEMSAAKLDKKDLFGKSDPYVIIKADGVELARTNTVKKSLDPEWQHVTLYFKIPIRVADMADNIFLLEVWDYDKGKSDDEIGSATCSLLDMKRRTNLTLIPSKNRRGKRKKSSGTLFITKCVPQVFTAY